METIKAVIFDLDGTLVDAYPAIAKSFNFTMRKLGLPKQSSRIIRQAVGWGDKNLLKPFLGTADLKSGLRIYRQHHQQALLKGSSLFPGAKKILIYLKNKGYKLAVASNRPTKFSRILVRHLEVEQFFDYLLCADRLKKAKPHPEILRRILRKFGLLPNQALYIGDMTIDAQTGSAAGIKTILVTTGSHTRRQMRAEKPYRIIRKVSDLRKIL